MAEAPAEIKRTEYGRPFCSSEELVSSVIDQILTDGGQLLWQHYLHNKSFNFATTAVCEALVNDLRMCYVSFDEGETSYDGWSIEEEPMPQEVDAWARMHLSVRKPGFGRMDETSGNLQNQAPGRANMTTYRGQRILSPSKARSGDGRKTAHGGRIPRQEPRNMPLNDENQQDEEEERMRESKAQEEVRRRDKEKKAKESEKSKEEERRKVQSLHEEMARRPHTFDLDGNLIWVEELKPERMPKLQDETGFLIKKDPKQRAELNAGQAAAPAEGDTKSQRLRRQHTTRNKKGEGEKAQFTDSFSRLQHGQPPILETMVVQPGVAIESQGKKKAGPERHMGERQMSRKEYVALAEREVAADFNFSASQRADSPDAKSAASGSPQRGQAVLPGTTPVGAAAGNINQSLVTGAGQPRPAAAPAPGGLPAVPSTRGSFNAAVPEGGEGGGGGGSGRPPQKAPAAPSFNARGAKQFEALGHMARPPRYHMPQLGAPYGYGIAQPPLGATMGHGLLRSGSLKEAYFFPPPIP